MPKTYTVDEFESDLLMNDCLIDELDLDQIEKLNDFEKSQAVVDLLVESFDNPN